MLSHLTERQRHVFELLAEGCATKTIARRLDLAVGTVKVHSRQFTARWRIEPPGSPGQSASRLRIGVIPRRDGYIPASGLTTGPFVAFGWLTGIGSVGLAPHGHDANVETAYSATSSRKIALPR